jgi:hypothetical protein
MRPQKETRDQRQETRDKRQETRDKRRQETTREETTRDNKRQQETTRDNKRHLSLHISQSLYLPTKETRDNTGQVRDKPGQETRQNKSLSENLRQKGDIS